MASRTLSHHILPSSSSSSSSLPFHHRNLPNSASPYLPHHTLQPHHQAFLRQMMHKAVDRPPMPELLDPHLPHRPLDGGCVLPAYHHHRAPAADAHRKLVEGAYRDDHKVPLALNEDLELKPGAADWLNAGPIPRQQQPAPFVEEERRKLCGCEDGSQCVNCSFLHLQPDHARDLATHPSDRSNAAGCTQWLPTQIGMANSAPHRGAAAVTSAQLVGHNILNNSMMPIASQQTKESADINHSSSMQARGLLDLYSDAANSSDLVDGDAREDPNIWQTAKLKADIVSHPLYEELLAAHAACLRIGTPVGQLTRIEEQLAQSQQVHAKYSVLAGQNNFPGGDEKDELDQFMTDYVILLCTFRDQLQQHVREHAMEAILSCWELQQSLFSLTGAMPGAETGATMSDDDDDQAESNQGIYDAGIDGGFGPLIPTETERSLMERVRQELKVELKQGYKDRIVDVREEILRKRRAGKLPVDTTSALKAWWEAHSKWPYPTEEEKTRLVQETGLQLKQINNWFINQRKRNWHNNLSPSTSSKNRRKR